MCHLVDAAAVDAYGSESHGDADALIEIVDGLYALLGSASAKHVLTKRGDALHHLCVQFACGGVEDMTHPAWSDDGKSLAVGDVVMA